jgi:hypothetical protein
MRQWAIFFAFLLMLGGGSVYAADCIRDTPGDQVGDWFGTFGKTGIEKDQILARRKAKRVGACVNGEVQKVMKQVRKAGQKIQGK